MQHGPRKSRKGRALAGLLAGLVACEGVAVDQAQSASAANLATPRLTSPLASPAAASAACPAEEAVTDESSLSLDPATIPTVTHDPFYTPPAGFQACPKGYVLRSRKVNAMWGFQALSTSTLSTVIGFLEKVPMLSSLLTDLPIVNNVAKNLHLDAYQLIFRSTDSHDRPIAAAITVVVPQGGIWKTYANKMHLNANLDRDWNAPTTARPLVTFQVEQDATNLDLAPSYGLRVGVANKLFDERFWVTPPPEAAAQGIGDVLNRLGLPGSLWPGPKNKIPKIAASDIDGILAVPALLEGYAVAVPDHEGDRGGFIDGKQSGQIVLDGIRAAINYQHYKPGAAIDDTSKVALLGYSGGTLPTAWAVELANSYAPDLTKHNLVGAAIGGNAAADLGKVLEYNDKKFTVGFLPLAVSGLIKAYPEYDIEGMLTDRGKAFINEGGEYGTIDGIIQLFFKWLDDTHGDVGVSYYSKDPSRPINSWPAVAALERINSINVQPSQAGHPRIPTLMYHDQQDGVAPVDPADAMIRKYCSEGSPVQVARFSTPTPSFDILLLGVLGGKSGRVWELIARDAPGVLTHISTALVLDLPAVNYLSGRFNGAVPRNDCGQIPYATSDNNAPGKWNSKLLIQYWTGKNAPWEPQPGLLPGSTTRAIYKPFGTN